MGVRQSAFDGFVNPADPTPHEVRQWAYQPDAVPAQDMPQDWDLLVASSEHLRATVVSLAYDPECPARRFALHCLYIYAAYAIRSNFRVTPRRRLRRMVSRAERDGDEAMRRWAHNTRALLAHPELFDYHEWCEGGLVRQPRHLQR